MTTNPPVAHSAPPRAVEAARLLASLRGRYACKAFDPAKQISGDDWQALEQSLVLAPSSFGLQPWLFVEVRDKGLREQLVPASWGQRQVADASRLVVFAVRTALGAADIERHLSNIARVRGVTRESLQPYADRIGGFLQNPPPGFDLRAWSARQVYLALGFFLEGCALLGIDACPIEGLEPARYDEILGLRARGVTTLCAAAAGYRAAGDKYQHAAKVRFPADEVILRL